MKDKGFRKPWNRRWAIQDSCEGMCVEVKVRATRLSDIAKSQEGEVGWQFSNERRLRDWELRVGLIKAVKRARFLLGECC